jgi:DnaK suppressor protein
MADDLTEEQEEHLHAQLEAVAVELTGLLATRSDRTATVDLDQPIGRLSRMDAIQQQKMAQAQIRRHELRLQQVEQALSTFEETEYGQCRKCEEPIGFRRLQARPETPFCIDCQGAIERRR